jgi:phage gpG-like protein
MRTIELDSLDELPQVFLDLEAEYRAATYAEPLGLFAEELRDAHGRMFDREEDPTGRPWEPWHWRPEDAYHDKPTLMVSGRLRSSLESQGGEHIETVRPRDLVFGTSVPYAEIHQEGATITTGIPLVGRDGGYIPAGTVLHIPQREHVGMNGGQVDRVAELAADHLVDTLGT